MVALNDKFAGQNPWCGPAPAEFPRGAASEAYDTDAYGNTLIFIEPGSDGRWFTDDDVPSSYGANEIIYCGYRFVPESQLYYVRNRNYNPVLGRWIQRDPIGYAGGINLYEYVDELAAGRTDPSGFGGRTLPPPAGFGIHGGEGIVYRHGVPFPNNNNTSDTNARGYFGPQSELNAPCCQGGKIVPKVPVYVINRSGGVRTGLTGGHIDTYIPGIGLFGFYGSPPGPSGNTVEIVYQGIWFHTFQQYLIGRDNYIDGPSVLCHVIILG